MTTYGTYQRFEYKTVNLKPIKSMLMNLTKILLVLLAFVLLNVAVLFVVNVVVSMFAPSVAWIVANGWQLSTVPVVFGVSWGVKP